jgi:hypothetical protein
MYKITFNPATAEKFPNSLFEISSSNAYIKSLTQFKAFHATFQTVAVQFLQLFCRTCLYAATQSSHHTYNTSHIYFTLQQCQHMRTLISGQLCTDPSLEVNLYMYGASLKTQKSAVEPVMILPLIFCYRLQTNGQAFHCVLRHTCLHNWSLLRRPYTRRFFIHICTYFTLLGTVWVVVIVTVCSSCLVKKSLYNWPDNCTDYKREQRRTQVGTKLVILFLHLPTLQSLVGFGLSASSHHAFLSLTKYVHFFTSNFFCHLTPHLSTYFSDVLWISFLWVSIL